MHNTLWGSERTVNNGQVIADLLDEKNLVCMNDGNKTRIDVSLFPVIGSGHYPASCLQKTGVGI